MILTNESVKDVLIDRAAKVLLRVCDCDWTVGLDEERRALQTLRNWQASHAIPAAYKALKTELMAMVFAGVPA